MPQKLLIQALINIALLYGVRRMSPELDIIFYVANAVAVFTALLWMWDMRKVNSQIRTKL